MLKCNLTFIISLVFIFPLQSQDFISKIFDFDNRSDLGSITITINDTLLILSRATNDSLNQCAYLIKTDLEGELIWDMHIDSLDPRNRKQLLATSEGGFIVSGSPSNGQEDKNLKLMLFNNLGNLINEFSYGENLEDEYSSGIFKLTDGYLLNASILPEDEEGLIHPILIKLNQDFEVVWETELSDNLYQNYQLKWAQEDSQGNIYASGREGSFFNYSVMIKLNAEGEQLWRYSHPENNRLYGGEGLLLDDNNIYLTGARDFTIPEDGESWVWPIFIMKINSEGELVWEKNLWHLEDRFLTGLQIKENGEIILSGSAENNLTGIGGGCWIEAYDADFNSIWERYVIDQRYVLAYKFVRDANEQANGNLVFTGRADSALPGQNIIQTDTYLLITDSIGCLEPNCGFIQIIDEDGNYSTLTATEDIQQNSTNPLSVKVYPNPAQDILSIELLGEQPELNKLELTDAVGRILKNYPVQNQVNFTLTLPPSAKGIYFLKGYTDAGIWTKKIVVE
jgi:hypothetical protein